MRKWPAKPMYCLKSLQFRANNRQMKHSSKAPAINNLLPELLPFSYAAAEVYPVKKYLQLEKLVSDCCGLWTTDHKSANNWSLLTPAGYPMELTFRCDSNDLYITTETSPKDTGISTRLQTAQRYSGEFSSGQHPELKELSTAGGQRYGCWLGVRNKEDQNQYKLYHEVTAEAREFFIKKLFLLIGKAVNLPELIPLMAGLVPGVNGIAEFYCRIARPSVYNLEHLCALGGVTAETRTMLDHLCWMGGMNREQLLSRVRFGISFQAMPGQRPGITIFVHAAQICPSNVEIRSRLISFARQSGYQMPLYEKVTERLLINDPGFPVHGMISLKPGPGQNIFFTVGIGPW